MGLKQLMLASGLPAHLPGMYDVLCIPHATFCQYFVWVGSSTSSVLELALPHCIPLRNSAYQALAFGIFRESLVSTRMEASWTILCWRLRVAVGGVYCLAL